MANCKTCQADIVWAKLPSGKRMPVDAAPSPAGSILLGYPTADGSRQASVIPEPDRGGYAELHVSHFSTCPDADGHRRTR